MQKHLNNMNNYSIVYHLHKDNSPTIIPNLTEVEADKLLKETKKDYPKAYRTTNDKADKVLEDFGKRFIKKRTQEEIWFDWAVGKK